MAEIFISYKSERRPAAEHFAEVLKRHGFSVWFDYELVKGKDFAAQIERQVREAKALVALWCSLSVTSRWVREEMHLAHDLGILVPVKIEACETPFGFRLADTIDLAGWDGAPRSPALDPLIDALEGRIGRDAVQDRRALIEYESTWRRFGARTLKDFALNKALEPAETARFSPELAPPPAPSITPAERDWERFGIAESEDVEDIEAYIKQYEASEPLWAVKAKKRLLVAKTTQLERAETRYRDEGRIRIAATIPSPVGLEWFLPGAGKAESFKDTEFAPEMVVVPAGSFSMGTGDLEIEVLANMYRAHFEREAPKHKVKFFTPFAIGKCAVTVSEYLAAVKAGGCRPPEWMEEESNYNARTGSEDHYKALGGALTAKGHPIVGVSWDDANAFAKWLSAKTGSAYRLPSEAEWEYACRAGTRTAFWWGDTISTAQANYNGNETYLDGPKGEYRQKTLPVDSFEPNPWGLYQVHGNVWEWCEDTWHDDYNGAPGDGSAWMGGDDKTRAVRGGSWCSRPRSSRAAYRMRYDRVGRDCYAGFRLVRAL
jgi:formylglycine-generating enzyme required for sulfatase activity